MGEVSDDPLNFFLCGSRFGKGMVRPGGVGTTLVDDDRSTIRERLAVLRPQLEHVIDLIFNSSTVRARFDGCGIVSRADANHLGLVGPAGRACGLPYDVRRVFPTEHYAEWDIPEYPIPRGDVYARARIRADEIIQSMTLGYEGKATPPPWGQLLRAVKALMKDSEDLKTARRILRF